MMSMRAARAFLQATGVLLVIGSIFNMAVTTSRAHGLRELDSIILSAVLMMLCGIGFLLPQLLAKLLAALAMASGAVWLFCTDAFRWENWWIYCLLFVPLLLTLWLGKGQGSSPFRRLPDAN